jgi:single-stranded-DNA-specific exonuclease
VPKTVWKVKEVPKKDAIFNLSAQLPTLKVDTIKLLLNRGIENFESAKLFFNPEQAQLHDPFLMKDMGVAVNLLSEAILNNTKILLYGDYDVDGSCSVALSYSFLKQIGAQVEYYIPDRYSEGYGVSSQGVEYAIDSKIGLLITMDCGIRAVPEVKSLKEAGISVIVCDHHEPGEDLPIADAVLDAKQLDCNYPFKELCGCGVVFKLLHAFCIQQGIDDNQIFQFVDVLALATCADIVPMVGENRVFVRLGIQKINSKPSIGLATLKEKAALDGVLNVRSLVFGFAPRINAAGRIEHAKGAVELLIAEDVERANYLADKVNELNLQRRELDKDITEDVLDIIAKDKILQEKNTTVLAHESWHKGVIGIVASRCIENYHRPTIIFKQTDDYLTGSARSVGDFDILKAIEHCDHLLGKYGGHKFAAGLTLHKDNFDVFCEEFESIVSQTIDPEDLVASILIEQELDLDMIDFVFYNILERMEPFGPNNMQPVFLSKNVLIDGEARLLKEEHLKFQIKNKLGAIDCIGFNMKEDFNTLDFKQTIDIVYTIEVNEYKGRKSLQLMLRDLAQSETF